MITKPIEGGGSMMLLPPAKDCCQTCGSKHSRAEPHNAHSMYYQTAFNMQHGRAPDWRDALVDVDPDMRAKWVTALNDAGIDVEAGQLYPKKVSW